MNKRFCVLTMMVALALVASSAFAQEQDTLPAHARFTRLPAKPSTDANQPATSLQTWAGTFTYQGTDQSFHHGGH